MGCLTLNGFCPPLKSFFPAANLPQDRGKALFNHRMEWLKMTRNCAKRGLDQCKLILCFRCSHRTKPEIKLVTEITCVWRSQPVWSFCNIFQSKEMREHSRWVLHRSHPLQSAEVHECWINRYKPVLHQVIRFVSQCSAPCLGCSFCKLPGSLKALVPFPVVSITTLRLKLFFYRFKNNVVSTCFKSG